MTMTRFSEHTFINFRKIPYKWRPSSISSVRYKDVMLCHTRGTKRRIGTIFTIIIILEFIFRRVHISSGGGFYLKSKAKLCSKFTENRKDSFWHADAEVSIPLLFSQWYNIIIFTLKISETFWELQVSQLGLDKGLILSLLRCLRFLYLKSDSCCSSFCFGPKSAFAHWQI